MIDRSIERGVVEIMYSDSQRDHRCHDDDDGGGGTNSRRKRHRTFIDVHDETDRHTDPVRHTSSCDTETTRKVITNIGTIQGNVVVVVVEVPPHNTSTLSSISSSLLLLLSGRYRKRLRWIGPYYHPDHHQQQHIHGRKLRALKILQCLLLLLSFSSSAALVFVQGWYHTSHCAPYRHRQQQQQQLQRSNTIQTTYCSKRQHSLAHLRLAATQHQDDDDDQNDDDNDRQIKPIEADSHSNNTNGTSVLSCVSTNDTIIQNDASLLSMSNNNSNGNTLLPSAPSDSPTSSSSSSVPPSADHLPFLQRVMQLEQLVSAQQVQIRQLTNQVQELMQTTEQLTHLLAVFVRDATTTTNDNVDSDGTNTPAAITGTTNDRTASASSTGTDPAVVDLTQSIFGTAPATVMDAADAAGAAILAGILGGKQRMLVDVRDAELSFRPEHSETLVQFIELAILPVAAGLEGLRSRRNRLKVVFPTVSHLLTYRKSMALSAPDVVALSTLGFDPVEQKDNLVVILVPSPDDDEGLLAMNELLSSQSIIQPVVVINHHMVPVTGPASTFEVAYHLRLLSVQYMSGDNLSSDRYFRNITNDKVMNMIQGAAKENAALNDVYYDADDDDDDDDALLIPDTNEIESVSLTVDANISSAASSPQLQDLYEETTTPSLPELPVSEPNVTLAVDSQEANVDSGHDSSAVSDPIQQQRHEAEVEAAMKHAQLVGMHQGSTRAMVIRAYPRAWHVFVDTSPDTDADYEVAAIFADEPSIDQVNNAIVECIEGSELEDELVAQQMQQAFESGQLDRVSELLASMGLDDLDDDDDDDDPYMKMFGEDTV